MSDGLRGLNVVGDERKCVDCQQWFPKEEFKVCARQVWPYCKSCTKARQGAHRKTEKFKASHSKWYKKYKSTEQCKEIWRKNAAKARASKSGKERIAKYYATPEVKKAKSEYHAKRNQTERAKEQRRKNQEKYRKTPKGMAVMRAHAFRRKLAKLKTPVGDLKAIEKWLVRWMLKSKVRCYWCRGSFKPSECHTDHVQPLIDGGHHALGNLCISCAPCNLRKHSKNLSDWNEKLKEPALL